MKKYLVCLALTMILEPLWASEMPPAVTYAPKTYQGIEMRKTRRVGVGFEGAGHLGTLGINLELNFTPQSGLVAGVGGGKHFQSFSFRWKKLFNGHSVVPYVTLGYARWFTVGKIEGPVTNVGPSLLKSRFLNNKQKLEKRIAEDLLTPSIGVQYVQLQGSWIGTTLFAEIVLLVDMHDLVTAPTGSVGVLYYF